MRSLPFFLLSFLFASAALAEDSQTEAEAPAEAPAVEEHVADDLAPSAEPTRADESIYVVQQRVYSKSGKLELTPVFFTSLNNKFVGHYGFGLSGAYHVRENFALELMTSVPYLMDGFYSALVYEVYDQHNLAPEPVDLKQMSYFGAVSAQLSALYGKMTFYDWLIDYDFYVSAGFGLVSTLEAPLVGAQGCAREDDQGNGRCLVAPDDLSDRFKLSGNLGGGMRLFFKDYLGLRLEVRNVTYADRAVEASEVTTDIRNHVLFVGGVTILL